MKDFFERNHKIFAVLGSTLIIGIIAMGVIFGPLNSVLPESLREKLGYQPKDKDNPKIVKLIVNYQGILPNFEVFISILNEVTATPYSLLLSANLTVNTIIYANGYYVKGINGIQENTSHHWFYYIDGNLGLVASNKYELIGRSVGEVLWIYKT